MDRRPLCRPLAWRLRIVSSNPSALCRVRLGACEVLKCICFCSTRVIASAASRLSTIYGPLPDPLPPLDFRTYHVVRRSAAPAKSGPETRGRKRRGEAFKSKEVIDDEDEEWAEGGQQ